VLGAVADLLPLVALIQFDIYWRIKSNAGHLAQCLLLATYAKKSENDENSCIPAQPIFWRSPGCVGFAREIMVLRWMATELFSAVSN